MTLQTNSAEVKKTATELYKDLTSYDNLLFIFLYNDVAAIMARTSKLLQQRNIQISDVGHQIIILCKKLSTTYPCGAPFPVDSWNNSNIDDIFQNLFGNDLSGLLHYSKSN